MDMRNIYSRFTYGNVFSVYWNDPALCVRCGKELTDVNIQLSVDNGVAPCCPDCHMEVKEEMALNMPVWSNGFYGHWCQTSEFDAWVQI